MSLDNAPIYSENQMAQALWGQTIFASRPSTSSKLTVQSGDRNVVRTAFASTGTLSDESKPWAKGGVMAISHDLGDVTTEQAVTLAIGHVREEAINYFGKPYTGYYRSKYPDTASAVSHFLDDFEDAQSEATILDSDIASKSTAVGGGNYSDIVTLSLRQAHGGIDLVIPNDTLDTNDTLAFIKEISSDGNVNTIDIIFPAFPMYYTMNPEYIRLLLEPVVRYLESGRWKQPYPVHDIGSHYPNATGHDDQKAEKMPIEESGNILILAHAYTVASGNTAWAASHKSLFQSYADYLAANSINIVNQLSTTDTPGPLTNETNLAVKAAVGLKAFGALYGMTKYSDIGDAHAKLFYDDGLGTDDDKTHFALEYPNNKTTYKVTFNLYPDKLLNLSTFSQSTYDMQSAYYPTIRKEGGVALDNRQWWGKTDWNIWVGSVSSDSTKKMFVDDIWAFISSGVNEWPFSDRWVVSSTGATFHPRNNISTFGPAPKPVGQEFALRARPTVGGHFAMLALKGAKYLKW